MQRLTALQIINRAAMELGLQTSAEVAASTEMTGQQMLALLNAAGNDMVMAHPWSELNVTYEFDTVIDQASYAVPADYSYYIDQTMWNKTSRWPVVGPINAQEWQRLIAGVTGDPLHQLFRMQSGKIEISPVPAAEETITYQYVSSNWVVDGSDDSVTRGSVDTDADVPIFNSELMIKALKVKMWNAKGLDTGMLMAEYAELFNFLTGKDKGARVLSLSGRPNLSGHNVPNGNWAA